MLRPMGTTLPLLRARSLPELATVLRPEPLVDDTWEQWVDTDAARGNHTMRKVVLKFRAARDAGRRIRMIFAGHRGAGKSTELGRVVRELTGSYLPVTVRVADRYNLPTLDYRQLMFCCAEVFVETAVAVDAQLSDEQVSRLTGWFDETLVEEVGREEWGMQAEAGARVGFLKALFARFHGRIFRGGEQLVRATRHIEERLDRLLEAMELVVEAIEAAIAPNRLLLILDDLDKLGSWERAHEIFVQHRLQLLSLPCSTVITFPVSLWYAPGRGPMAYGDRCLLPMISVAAPPGEDPADGGKSVLGRSVLSEIVRRRLAVGSELIHPPAMELAVRLCGGIVRDLFQLLRDAGLEAQVAGREQVQEGDVRVAANALRGEYANRISPPADDTELRAADLYQLLDAPESWPRRHVEHSRGMSLLLDGLCVLEYNGETWYDLHPLVREHLLRRRQDEERHAVRGG